MPPPEAKAITAVWSNVPPEHEEEIRKWHSVEHTTERLAGPGYIACRRYNRESGDGMHGRLTVFEGMNLDTFNSPYYLESRNNPTPWTRKSMGLIRDARRGVFELIHTHGERPRVEPPWVYTVRFNLPPGEEAELLAWFREEHFPRLCALEAVTRARLFRRAEEVSNVKTEETRMQGPQEGQQSHLAFYEVTSAEIVGGPAWKEAAAGTPRSAETLGKLLDLVREVWWWEFVKYAPGVLG